MTNRVADDPRIDPRIRKMFAKAPPTLLPNVESREELLSLAGQSADRSLDTAAFDPAPYEAFSPADGLAISTRQVTSQPDGNSINLQFIVPEGEGGWPCVYYMHGGGMMMGSCFDPMFSAWGRLVAANGVAVAMVDFRNAVMPSSAPGIAPYPAGLDDCVSGLRWVHDNAAELGIDPRRVVIAGESGGANLTLATAMRLKRDGALGLIAGIFVMCPYLAGEWTGEEGSSALENAGILMDARSNYGAVAYGIEQLHSRNPLAWPAFASEEDVAGLPPVIINVNECDPLRDDGVNFYRLLLRAGVTTRCRIIMGTVHATEVMGLACPEISRSTARELAQFCADG
ncbi:MAG: alpha/beta hydrolase fold domain-containing protein [Novosphingobium sp.]|nr:alpha/beta hydrolase fold domain-containing protein [Novosphingobium sp.]MCP5404252.1 alpha/beta hydrolase fold domain-containing protein [Novosphingobium sp.]